MPVEKYNKEKKAENDILNKSSSRIYGANEIIEWHISLKS